MGKLKKCPFCGGCAKYNVRSYWNGSITRGWEFTIRCTNCGCVLPTSYKIEVELTEGGEIHTIIDERTDAENDWNRRADC